MSHEIFKVVYYSLIARSLSYSLYFIAVRAMQEVGAADEYARAHGAIPLSRRVDPNNLAATATTTPKSRLVASTDPTVLNGSASQNLCKYLIVIVATRTAEMMNLMRLHSST
jgi:hypothetical protein